MKIYFTSTTKTDETRLHIKFFSPIAIALLSLCWTPAVSAATAVKWVSLASTKNEKIIQLTANAEHIYALTDQKRVLLLGQNERNWVPLDKGLENYQKPQAVSLSVHQNNLFAFVASNDWAKSDVFRLQDGAWKALGISVRAPDEVESIFALNHEIIVSRHIEASEPSLRLIQKNGAWQEQKLPSMQWLKIRPGKIHPIYGLSGMVYILDAKSKWKALGEGWPNTEATDVIEVGPTIYVANIFYPGGRLLRLKSGEKKWGRTSISESCSFNEGLIPTNNMIFTKADCKKEVQDKEIQKIFSYSTTRDQWREIESPVLDSKIGPLLVQGSFLYAATSDGRLFKYSI